MPVFLVKAEVLTPPLGNSRCLWTLSSGVVGVSVWCS